jgi:hypothetical protein
MSEILTLMQHTCWQPKDRPRHSLDPAYEPEKTCRECEIQQQILAVKMKVMHMMVDRPWRNT